MTGTRVTAACALLFAVATAEFDPSYDHQHTTYIANRKPAATTGEVQLTPFFSPDTSLPVLLDVIENAKETLDIGTPGWSSWIGCTYFDPGEKLGCPAERLRNEETFPIWPAVLNAIHRGVRVRILTNFYNTPASPGLVEPVAFLRLAGAEVIAFETVTFLHAKYVCADGKRAAVSSVNFSHASMARNREAGVLVEGVGGQAAIAYWTSVFEDDMKAGVPWPLNQTYNASVLAVIQDKTPLPVNHTAPGPMCDGCYIPPRLQVGTHTALTTTASPDDAFSFFTGAVNATQASLEVMMYQVTDDALCSSLADLHARGVNVTLLVSKYIYDSYDWHLAQQCYQRLHDAGLRIRRTFADSKYQYSHQKFWIVDGKTVYLSTGNWSPSDLPDADVFPPHGQPGWRHANRDFTLHVADPLIVQQYRAVLNADYAVGSDWQPRSSLRATSAIA